MCCATMPDLAGQAGWRGTLRRLVVDVRNADILAALTAACVAVVDLGHRHSIVLWLVVLVPTIDGAPSSAIWRTRPAPYLSVCRARHSRRALVGGHMVGGPDGIKPVAKLLMIPFLLYHFQRSQRGIWFLRRSSFHAPMMILSWIVLFYPAFKLRRPFGWVPVKNYIDQSQEFALCAFALALLALVSFRERRFAGPPAAWPSRWHSPRT